MPPTLTNILSCSNHALYPLELYVGLCGENCLKPQAKNKFYRRKPTYIYYSSPALLSNAFSLRIRRHSRSFDLSPLTCWLEIALARLICLPIPPQPSSLPRSFLFLSLFSFWCPLTLTFSPCLSFSVSVRIRPSLLLV